MFTEGDIEKRGIRIMKDGKPVQFSDLNTGDRLMATIITTGTPQVMTERLVKARLSEAPPVAAGETIVVAKLRTTGVVVRADREDDRVRLVPAGSFDLAHATTAAHEIANAEKGLNGCRAIELDLSDVGHIDGTGAVLLARFLDRLAAAGRTIHVAEERNREASNL